MLPPKLTEYIKLKHSQGYPDQMILDQLKKMGWPDGVLDEVYKSLNVSEKDLSTTAPVLDYVTLGPSTLSDSKDSGEERITQNNTSKIEELPKKWGRIFLILFGYLSFSYILQGGIFTLSYLILQINTDKLGGYNSFIHNFPTILAIPTLFVFVGLYFLFITFNIRSFTLEIWRKALQGLTTVLITFYIIANLLLWPLSSYMLEAVGNFNYIFPNDELILVVVLLVLLFKYKKFTRPSNEAIKTSQNKIYTFLNITVIFLLLSSIAWFGFRLIPGDIGYKDVSEKVDFKIYKVNKMPNNMVYATGYSIATDDLGYQDVKVAIDTKLNKYNTIDKNSPIVILQRRADANINLEKSFGSNYSEPFASVDLREAKNKIGILGKAPMGKVYLYNLKFITQDGVLISIISPDVNSDRVLEVANNLK